MFKGFIFIINKIINVFLVCFLGVFLCVFLHRPVKSAMSDGTFLKCTCVCLMHHVARGQTAAAGFSMLSIFTKTSCSWSVHCPLKKKKILSNLCVLHSGSVCMRSLCVWSWLVMGDCYMSTSWIHLIELFLLLLLFASHRLCASTLWMALFLLPVELLTVFSKTLSIHKRQVGSTIGVAWLIRPKF